MGAFSLVSEAVGTKRPKTSAELLPLVYRELRRLASWRLAQERRERTLQPTALVHEAFLRLLDDDSPHWNSRKHFFSAAAEAMRRILVEEARKKQRLKRLGDHVKIPLENLSLAVEADSETLLLAEEALTSLAAVDPFKADLVRLRFFVGLRNTELARVLGVSEATVKRHWAFARAWLYGEIQSLRAR